MRALKHTLTLFATLYCLWPLSGYADAWQPLDVARRYNMYWGGVHVGYMVAEIRKDKKGTYHFEVQVKSKGLLEWVSNYESVTVANFKLEKGKVVPLYFFSDGHLRKKHSSTVIKYNKRGKIIHEATIPPKKTWKHKEVPASLLKNAQNPLTGAVESREMLKDYIERGYARGIFNVPIYDGKRLGDYHFTLLGDSKTHLKRGEVDVFGVRLGRKPIAGFSHSELKTLKDEPAIDIFFLKDEMFLPVKAEAKIPFGGSAVILFDQDCVSIGACLAAK